jgi:hypothetical protein
MTITAEDLDDVYEGPEPIYCPFCLKAGYRVNLGPKILQANEPRPEDYETGYNALHVLKSFHYLL